MGYYLNKSGQSGSLLSTNSNSQSSTSTGTTENNGDSTDGTNDSSSVEGNGGGNGTGTGKNSANAPSPSGNAPANSNSDANPPTIGAFKGSTPETVDLINDVISGATDSTIGTGVRTVTQPDGSSIEDDFEQFVEEGNGTSPNPIETPYGPGEMTILPDGTKVIARPGSKTTGLPTIEIQRPAGGKALEIRYPN